MKLALKNLPKNTWIQHLSFWVLSLYFIGNYFSISNELKVIDFIYSGFFHLPLFFLAYVNLRYHIPKFLLKEKYVIYALLASLNIAASYFIHKLVFDIMIPLLPTDFYMVSFTEARVLLTILLFYLVLTTLLKLSKSWYLLHQLERENLSLELNTLKMQINPHFLFNSLNSMYSLARKKSGRTPGVILMLSDLMRYMIYEVSDERVSIEKEIEAIHNYLDLQKLRVEEKTDIQFRAEVINHDFKVAPLLFFPLIENSFKHGMKDEVKSNYVHIDLSCGGQSLTFKIKNNKGRTDDIEKGKYGGIGLENVRKRLKLIYDDQAEMIIYDDKSTFEVIINIQSYD